MNQCLLCDGKTIFTLCENKTFSSDGKIYQCDSCKSCQVQPLPDASVLDEYYQREWSNDPLHMTGIQKKIFEVISALHMSTKNYFRWPFVKPHLKKDDHILEIGAGDGAFLTFLQKKGFRNLFAFEPSLQFQEKLRRKNIALSVPLWNSSHRYDICFAFHVLEHLKDPLNFLKGIKTVFKPGALILGEVPNVPFATHSLTPAEKETVFNNVHLFHCSAQGLKKLFEKAGFKEIECTEIGFSHKRIRKMFPKANCHLIHPSFKVSLSIKVQSFLHAIESFVMPAIQVESRDKQRGYLEPNDFIFFRARA